MVRTSVGVGVGVGLAVVLVAVPVAAAAAPTPTATERTCRGVTATLVGTSGDDRITGTRGDDVIVGLGGDDVVRGLAGDDLVCGNGGGDDLTGGRGHDRLFGGRDGYEQRTHRTVIRGDLLEGGPGDDHLAPGYDRWTGRILVLRRDTVTYARATRPVVVDLAERTASGEGSDTLVPGRFLGVDGSAHDDELRGSRRPETLDGGRGDDRLFGGGGRDAVLGYRGDDQLHGEAGQDLVVSTAGRSTVDGGDGNDWVVAASPASTLLLGGAGIDYLSRRITPGETGLIDGGTGEDQLELITQLWFDRDPSATLDAAAGTAVVTAGSDAQTSTFTSIDYFTLWGSPWTFLGTGARDFVQVLDDPMTAHGLGGDDYLLGGDRADVLDGGDGTDTVWGGRGRNTCTNAEIGECDAYPWDTEAVRARVADPAAPPLGRIAPRELVMRWTSRPRP